MKCPFCQSTDNRVLESRLHRDGDMIRRRRECLSCKERFTTQETLVPVLPLVCKKDGRRETFSREKVLNGVKAACQKRPISSSAIDNLTDDVVKWASERHEKEISSSEVGTKVMSLLRKTDNVAYVRFASVYRTFRDVHEFVETLAVEEVQPEPEQPTQVLS